MITKNFIKMCEKAEEIQKLQPTGLWHIHSIPHDDGLDDKDYLYVSFYYLPKVRKERNIQILKWDNDEGHPIIGSYSDDTEGAIWLPTQEQLQEMMIPTLGKNFIGCMPFVLNERLKESLFYEGIYNWEKTYNELWLAFVMKEKYNKVWTSKDWQIDKKEKLSV